MKRHASPVKPSTLPAPRDPSAQPRDPQSHGCSITCYASTGHCRQASEQRHSSLPDSTVGYRAPIEPGV
eukprot:1962366-Rhodomonas_salina.1